MPGFARELAGFEVQGELMTNRRTECLSRVAVALWLCALASPAFASEGLPINVSTSAVESRVVPDAESRNLASEEAVNQAAKAARLDVDPQVNGSIQDVPRGLLTTR